MRQGPLGARRTTALLSLFTGIFAMLLAPAAGAWTPATRQGSRGERIGLHGGRRGGVSLFLGKGHETPFRQHRAIIEEVGRRMFKVEGGRIAYSHEPSVLGRMGGRLVKAERCRGGGCNIQVTETENNQPARVGALMPSGDSLHFTAPQSP